MKTKLRTVNDHGITYDALMFVCPGCESADTMSSGLHILPVNSEVKSPSWDWNGDLEAPTLSPSILTRGKVTCHSYLRDGVFEFLSDSQHPLAGQSVPMPNLPDWVANELSEDETGEG